MANDFKSGRRIAYDYVIDRRENDIATDNESLARDMLIEIYNQVGCDVSLTLHNIATNSDKWYSVVKKDTFFNDVIIYKKKDKFVEVLKENQILCRYDIKLLTALMLYVDFKKDTDWIMENVDKCVNAIKDRYFNCYKESLFKECNSDNDIVENFNLTQYSSIIIERVISTQNGFDKYKFIKTVLNDYVNDI